MRKIVLKCSFQIPGRTTTLSRFHEVKTAFTTSWNTACALKCADTRTLARRAGPGGVSLRVPLRTARVATVSDTYCPCSWRPSPRCGTRGLCMGPRAAGWLCCLPQRIRFYLKERLGKKLGCSDLGLVDRHFLKSEESEPVASGKQLTVFVASNKI